MAPPHVIDPRTLPAQAAPGLTPTLPSPHLDFGQAITIAAGAPDASSAPTLALGPRAPSSGAITVDLGDVSAPVVDVDVGGPDLDLASTRGPLRYESGTLLGAGGMGEVRLHVDRRIGRRIAKKTLHRTTQTVEARRRFLREIRVQGQLEHPAVVPVYDLDVDENGQIYFTMKRVRGETLERVIEHVRGGDPEALRRFGTRRLLSAFAQVCHAVHYAHTRNVLHRDLKPSNVMLGDFGEVYVLDWGLAKILGEPDPNDPGSSEHDAVTTRGEALSTQGEAATTRGDEPPVFILDALADPSGALTAGSTVLGTLAYMAPEQLAGRAALLDPRADVYALGAILFEILTLSRLRDAADLDPNAVVRSLTSGGESRPSLRVDSVPPELDELCVRALAIRPEDRLSSARELAEAVEHYLDGDQDLKLRRALAARHADAARGRLEGASESVGAAGRVDAMHETMRALALDADQPEAQRLLVELITDVSGAVPPEARPELDEASNRSRARRAQMGMQGFFAWLLALPVAVLIGVRSWLAVGSMAGMTVVAMLLARRMWRQGGFGARELTVLAGIVAITVALTSSYLGPFTLMPTCAATTAILFATAATRRERWLVATILSAGVLLPFFAEIAGVGPRAYAFEPGRIVVFERAIALPQGATMAAMLYSALSFIFMAMLLVGSMRDALSASEERQLLQAWYLRQLFPAAKQKSTT